MVLPLCLTDVSPSSDSSENPGGKSGNHIILQWF